MKPFAQIPARLGRLLDRRWLLFSLGLAITLVSTFLLYFRLESAYYEYWLYPIEKAADGYSYPQLRYTIFDSVLILWCVDGLIFSVTSVRPAVARRALSGWPVRSLFTYFAFFAVSILGGMVMLAARSHGY